MLLPCYCHATAMLLLCYVGALRPEAKLKWQQRLQHIENHNKLTGHVSTQMKINESQTRHVKVSHMLDTFGTKWHETCSSTQKHGGLPTQQRLSCLAPSRLRACLDAGHHPPTRN